jgi:hypothetical protein
MGEISSVSGDQRVVPVWSGLDVVFFDHRDPD